MKWSISSYWGSAATPRDLRVTRLLTVLFFVLVGSAACQSPYLSRLSIEPGEISTGMDEFGTYFTYMPNNATTELEILVLVHGTPPKQETEESDARIYINEWLSFADQNEFLLIAPVFTQEDFSSREGDHALSGYRGLFGREIGADEWVLRLTRAHQLALGLEAEPFHIYGHSAGGQFVARFLVTHPDEIETAVITAAATYPQPTKEVAWPFGMGELHSTIEWDADTIRAVDIVPDEQTWLAATQVPLTVIVGLEDRADLPIELIPGQNGWNRFTIARNWVQAMAAFAAERGIESRFTIWIIPGEGHSMSGLLAYSQRALLACRNEPTRCR